MKIMNIIFLCALYPILLIMYFLFRGAGDTDRKYCFGATLKKQLREDEKVKEIVTSYKKRLKRFMIILAIVPIPCFFIPHFSISMSIWMVWILAVCFIPGLLFGMANVKILNLKREKGWDEAYEISYTDLKTAVAVRKVTLKDFLAAIILSVVPVAVAFVLFWKEKTFLFVGIIASVAACTVLFFACAVWTDRQKVPIICCDSDINTNYARAKKQAWKNLWVYSAWINTIFTWCMLIFMWQRNLAVWGIIIGSIIYCAAVVALCIATLRKVQNIDKMYEDKKTLNDAAEDDKNWLFGQFYYNKNDKHYMVESRMGNGTTVNIGTKAGLITEIFTVFALLIIPIMCIWMIMVEFTPIKVTVENETIICEQLKVEYEIPFSKIESYTTLEELPKMTKLSGMGMDNLYSGTYEIWREGSFETFLNPQNQLFIRLVMEDGEVYYISGDTDEDTKELADILEGYGVAE